MFKHECQTCRGTGFLPQFAGYANGVCFPCKGRGFYMSKTPPAPKPEPVAIESQEDGCSIDECRPYRGPAPQTVVTVEDEDLDDIYSWRVGS